MKLSKILFNLSGRRDLFIFPYSNENSKMRDEIWQNLAKGILFEDKSVLIPWVTPFILLSYKAEQKLKSGDRTRWYLGKRTILGGYEANLEVMKWRFIPFYKPFKRVEENLGHDEKGFEKFNYLKLYLTDLLGDATETHLEKFGQFEIGTVTWKNGKVQIWLVGIEQFALKYSLHLGFPYSKSED